MSDLHEARVEAAKHSLSEYLNDNAPIGEEMYRGPARAAIAAADALVTEQMIASAILMVTQGDVSPEYAWEVQYSEVQNELLAQARAVLALLRGGEEQ